MKLFTKLALVSAVAISGQAMAMESLDDAALSSATGQEGITVQISTPDAIKINSLYLHDKDGYVDATKPGANTAGAIAVGTLAAGVNGATANQQANGITITQVDAAKPLLTLDIDADGGTSTSATGTTNAPFLNIGAAVGATKIEVGEISVVKSNTTATGLRRGGSDKATIIEGLTIDMGDLTANIQLGNTPQGAMIKLNSVINNGLSISNLSLKDNGGGGNLVLDSIKVADAKGTNLTVNSDISVKTNGLVVTDNGGPRDVLISGIHLGSAANASIGDLEINGLDMGKSTITVTGH